MYSYIGEWSQNKRHGNGTYTYKNGDAYTGQWEQDVKQGQGVYTYIESGSQVKNSVEIKICLI